MKTFDVNFNLNYSIGERTQDPDGKNITIPLHVNSHSFIYHTDKEQLEDLIKELKDRIQQVEELWITGKNLSLDLSQSTAQIAEKTSEQLLLSSTQNNQTN